MTATIELGFPETRKGIVVQVECEKSFDIERIIRGAALTGAGFAPELRRVNDPGWWSALICASALHHRFPVCVQRVHSREQVHADVEVARGSMLDMHPTWPAVTIGKRPMIDIRPEYILEAGPSDDDLRRYALSLESPDIDLLGLRRTFELGVLEWDSSRYPDGRWRIRGAI